jgi:hypothetical protein
MLIATVLLKVVEPIGQAAQLRGDLGRPAGLYSLRSASTRPPAATPATNT